MHTHSLHLYVDCLERNDLDGVGELMLSSARKLAACGADFLICPDNTIHQSLDRVLPQSPLPWLHIAEVVATEAQQRGWQRLGLLGTRWLVDSDVYPTALARRGLQCVKPQAAQRATLRRIIMDELVNGEVQADSVAQVQSIIQALAQQACDAVILGCTELPLIIHDGNAALPSLDSTRLLAKAALRRAVSRA